MVENEKTSVQASVGWRLKLGGAMLALSIVGPPVLLPVVASIAASGATTATVSGVILVGAELLALAAVAVMGKSGYDYLKRRALDLLKRYGPPKTVARSRYTVGLVMFAVPIVFGWLVPYAGALIPGYPGNEIIIAIVGDLLLVVSLFVLGGDFWDKLHALFIHDAKVVSD